MFSAQLSVQQWVELPSYIRLRLMDIFKLKRSSGSIVENGRLLTDGHTYEDLKGISVEAMQQFLNSDKKEYFTLLDGVLTLIEEQVMARDKAEQAAEAEQANVEAEKDEKAAIKAIAGMTEIVVKNKQRRKKV